MYDKTEKIGHYSYLKQLEIRTRLNLETDTLKL